VPLCIGCCVAPLLLYISDEAHRSEPTDRRGLNLILQPLKPIGELRARARAARLWSTHLLPDTISTDKNNRGASFWKATIGLAAAKGYQRGRATYNQ